MKIIFYTTFILPVITGVIAGVIVHYINKRIDSNEPHHQERKINHKIGYIDLFLKKYDLEIEFEKFEVVRKVYIIFTFFIILSVLHMWLSGENEILIYLLFSTISAMFLAKCSSYRNFKLGKHVAFSHILYIFIIIMLYAKYTTHSFNAIYSITTIYSFILLIIYFTYMIKKKRLKGNKIKNY